MPIRSSSVISIRKLFDSGHHFNIILHLNVLFVSLLHPNLKDASDAHGNTELSDDNRVPKVSMDGQLELVVEHENAQSVPHQHKDVIVHLELLLDVQANQPSCL